MPSSSGRKAIGRSPPPTKSAGEDRAARSYGQPGLKAQGLELDLVWRQPELSPGRKLAEAGASRRDFTAAAAAAAGESERGTEGRVRTNDIRQVSLERAIESTQRIRNARCPSSGRRHRQTASGDTLPRQGREVKRESDDGGDARAVVRRVGGRTFLVRLASSSASAASSLACSETISGRG